MKRQIQGMGMILLSILLVLSFQSLGIQTVFDTDIRWAALFLLLGIAGFFWMLRGDKTEK